MLGIESRALCLLGKHSADKLCSQPSQASFFFFAFYLEPESKLPKLALKSYQDQGPALIL